MLWDRIISRWSSEPKAASTVAVQPTKIEWDLVLRNRPISEVIRLFVLPEINKRKSDGILTEKMLPLEITQILAYQAKENGNVIPIVKLNEECDIVFRVALKEPQKYEKGQVVKVTDIELTKCFLVPPKHNGKPCGYFYLNRFFLTPLLVFDLSHNHPEFNATQQEFIPYPVDEMFRHKWLADKIKPFEIIELLIKKHWPPNPAYYPQVLSQIFSDKSIIESATFVSTLNSVFNEKFWEEKLEFWGAVNLFPKRLNYIRGAIKEYFEKDYANTIYVLCPQFEGIITDYSGTNPELPYKDRVDYLKSLILSRGILLCPRKFIDIVFEYLKSGTFWDKTPKISDPTTMINRHGILHGIFCEFESEELALRYLILMDTLAFILVSDRISSGKL